MSKKVLILGGAGFIGSNLAEKFYSNDAKVTVIDGLLGETGGSIKNIRNLDGKIKIIYQRIEEINNLEEITSDVDLIIDCMAWTSHKSALVNPFYDLELNCQSHLFLIDSLKKKTGKTIIFLSSRGVYGNVDVDSINEKTALLPNDIQGLHKLTAENYFKIYSQIYHFNVIALRIPNCYGKHQPITGDDIGLIGSFIIDSLMGKTIEVFGNNRKRNFLYIDNLVNIIWRISQQNWGGYLPFNVSGQSIPIIDLARMIINITGEGEQIVKDIPYSIKQIDIGDANIEEKELVSFIGEISYSDFYSTLIETINYFKENLN